ncbi:PASTA domain-containing protein [Saccharothrix texasensis]|uniref:PASTA domain-containing protein n=1 Tax=Saccharothrix texasensis TaxID=103734 RepID=A0A3N1H5K7_9PSEU|nr:PASTA domain-containing protein [Saccharothrix texasensis]ROP37706.1 PASTA domain-containing protein [Saccharothrix texasensis]
MTHAEVPHLVGLTVPRAREAGHAAGVVVTSRDPDGPPLGALTWPGTWIVTAQDPAAGRRVRRGAPVVIDFEESQT